MAYLADDLGDISKRIREIKKEEGRVDDNWRTATTADLDAIASGFGLERANYENDETLRGRIGNVLAKKTDR